jgi:hypothetical protein
VRTFHGDTVTTVPTDQAGDFVTLVLRRNRGWPWPEDSWGLSPMYGEDGWCPTCHIPAREQIGNLILRRSGLTATGAWVPNWKFDVLCLEEALAAEVAGRFPVALRPIDAPKSGERMKAMQLIIPTTSTHWFDEGELIEQTTRRHGEAGAACATCGAWRWLPLPKAELPPAVPHPSWAGQPAIASPEWFGAGGQSYRQVALARPLGELLAERSPRDFTLRAL